MEIKQVLLSSWNTFDIYGEIGNNDSFEFLIDDVPIEFSEISNNDGHYIFRLNNETEILGHDVKIVFNKKTPYNVNLLKAVDFEYFDKTFFYEGDDLGATYFKDHTLFKLWAPLASHVYLLINKKKYEMIRQDKGVFSFDLKGNLDGATYKYQINNNGIVTEAIDPYGKSSTSNGRLSAVINLEKLNIDTFDECLPHMGSYLDAIIYEANVRDMTIDEHSNISHKGKYLGLVEKGRKTPKGNPAGFDYIKSLGITHLQLMPVLDFETINEDNPKNSYNWGYDPMQVFTLEGSYSTKPNDPYSRMIEFKKLVSGYHQAGIRINLDIVFNHIYGVENCLFEKIVPGYYFRKDENNDFLNHSYCGNEFASEKPMVRKLFVDSIKFLITQYHVDGFRFDLMGLLDVVTMNQIANISKQLKNDIMLYGEGWDMLTETKGKIPLATMFNEKLIPDYAFFNDRYRNIARGTGGGVTLNDVGYLLGNESYKLGFEWAFVSSSFDMVFPKLFDEIDSSLNYIECHDNATLFDVINNSTEIENPFKVIARANAALILSFGIPFIHAGQEIALSKYNEDNTYNKGDKYNKFSYEQLDNYGLIVSSIRMAIAMRKEIMLYRCLDKKILKSRISFIDNGNIFHAKLVDLNNVTYHLIINQTSSGQFIKFDNDVVQHLPFGFNKNINSFVGKSFPIAKNEFALFKEV